MLDTSFEDSENNNVDENSNDNEYSQYANYHQQFYQEEQLRQSEARQLQLNLGQQSRLQGAQRLLIEDENDGSPSFQPRNRSRANSHRRNYSEDLNINLNDLPPLPSFEDRHSGLRNHFSCQDRWLPLPQLPRRPLPSEEETQIEARELLHNFTLQELDQQNIQSSTELPLISGYSNPAWENAGRDLRTLADAFSRSHEREILRRQAQEINVCSLTLENFFNLCCELFKGGGGITQERIVVLFTFISDIAVQQVRIRAERWIRTLMRWSLLFIVQRICSWVRQSGGWSVVLSTGATLMYNVFKITLAAAATVALGLYIKKALKEL